VEHAMQFLDNISLTRKFLVNFLLSGGVLIAAIVFCILQIRSVGNETHEIAQDWLPSVQSVGEISQLRLRYRVRSLEYMLPNSPEERAKMEKSMSELDQQLQTAFGATNADQLGHGLPISRQCQPQLPIVTWSTRLFS
jgi:methyl-accepting chemotaxis protein